MSARFIRYAVGAGALAAATMLCVPVISDANAQSGGNTPAGRTLQSMGHAEMARAMATSIPMERLLTTLPDRKAPSLTRRGRTLEAVVQAGSRGPKNLNTKNKLRFGQPAVKGPGGNAPENYGSGNLGTIYHYNDYLMNPYPVTYYPQRAVGYFYFQASNNLYYHCSAALINRSVIITAGHCVHDGGNQGAGWIKAAWFYPARSGSTAPYNYCYVNWVNTTGGWYYTGSLDAGYDVGIAVCGKRAGTTTEMGAYTGWFGFCVSNCLQSYWFLSQYGYPGNYYSGHWMTASQHLEHSDGYDYRYGTGMRGGSSGGPHVANVGYLNDSATNKGSWPYRNVIFAVTSWGYISEAPKIQGASTLSGRANGNNFKYLYNTACYRSRLVHGTSSCTNLP